METSGFKEPTTEMRTARRVLSLAIALTNSRSSWPTSKIRADFYPDYSDSAFKKAFKRDRERLEAAGIVIITTGRMKNEAMWAVDEKASYASDDGLSPDDALVLDFLLLPIAADPAFPYAQDLRVALAKIDRAFDGTSTASIPAKVRSRNVFLSRVEKSLLDRHAIRVEYTRADGSGVTRDLFPYGLFYLNGETYMVAADAEHDEVAHTYNLARIVSLKDLSSRHYEVPEDFDIRDFILLPFQLGPTIYEGEFFDPSTGEHISHEVADEDVAAAWAISEGLVPISPQTLKDVWKRRLVKASGEE